MPRKPHSKPPGDEDRAAFDEAMRDVQPLKVDERIQPPRRRPSPRPAKSSGVTAASSDAIPPRASEQLDTETGGELLYCRAGVPQELFRKLKRGKLRPAAELDLHGMNSDAAAAAIRRFLDESLELRLRCLRIIHGKGRRSGAQGPVLKELTASMLKREDSVLAFASAPAADGGTGATLVLLGRD